MQTPWIQRTFPRIEDNGLLPGLLERLMGTPVRLREKVRSLAEGKDLAHGTRWSLKKEIGHLSDLEPLHIRRVDEIIRGVAVMEPADMTNRRTEEAGHDAKTISELVTDFERVRKQLVDALMAATPDDLLKQSLHPRLQQPMRLVDIAYFTAEHDDHHLVRISALLRDAAASQ